MKVKELPETPVTSCSRVTDEQSQERWERAVEGGEEHKIKIMGGKGRRSWIAASFPV